MKEYILLVPINPEPWAIGDISITSKGGKRRPFVAPNKQLLNYQKAVREYIKRNYECEPFNTECELTFFFWRRLDVYMDNGSRVRMGHIADATNLQKGLEDALQGVVVSNDRLVRKVYSEIVEQAHNIDPGVIIIAREHYTRSSLDKNLLAKFAEIRKKANSLDLDNFI